MLISEHGEHLQELSELREHVNYICCSKIKLSKDWYENMDEISDLLLSREDTNLKRKLCKFIESLYKETEVNKQRAKNINELLTEKRRKLVELNNEKDKLKNEYEKLERKMNSNDKISENYRKKLLKFESMVQACKILTGTEFEYSCSHTSGYMYNEATNVLRAFSLDSINNRQKKEYLWSLMSKVYPVKPDVK